MRIAAEQREALEEAADSLDLVSIERFPRGAERVDGFVLGIGKKWALLQATSDGGYFDGYVAVRVRDISEVSIDESFQGRFARTQPQWPPVAPGGVQLDQTKRLIESMARLAPIIGIEQERRAAGVQWIGSLVSYQGNRLVLDELRPDATWSGDQLSFKVGRITRVEVGGQYKKALAVMIRDAAPGTAIST